MSPPAGSRWPRQPLARFFCLVAALACGRAASGAAPAPDSFVLTNLAQLRQIAGQERRQICSYSITGTVVAADSGSRLVFLQDESATEALEFDWSGHGLKAGQRVTLEATHGSISSVGLRLKLGCGPVAGNIKRHPLLENSGELFLTAGRHPIRVAWFNWIYGMGLRLEFEGPGLKRQPVPDSVLYHQLASTNGEAAPPAPGLRYRCYEGEWLELPDFRQLNPVGTGWVGNFDIGVRSRNDNVGLEFVGLIEVPRSGRYKFFVTSDDGCLVFIEEPAPRLAILGEVAPPGPQDLGAGPGHGASGPGPVWAAAEGELGFVTLRNGTVELELVNGRSRLEVQIASMGDRAPSYLARSRVRAVGICHLARNADGSVSAGPMLVPDWRHVQLLSLAERADSGLQSMKIAALLQTNGVELGAAVQVHGRLRAGSDLQLPLVEDESGAVPVDFISARPETNAEEVDVIGICAQGETGVVLRLAQLRPACEARPDPAAARPELTTAAQVQSLSRAEAARHYPVRLKGVVTWVSADRWAVVLQDASRGIYVRNYGNRPLEWPELGEYWQIEGVSDPADFSPVVEAQKARRLGIGRMPEPVRPTKDQLLSGSLDAQYVELQGIVTAVGDQRITLMTSAGKLSLAPFGEAFQLPASVENALVRMRGCLFPPWDGASHRVMANLPMRMGSVMLTVEEPANSDPFAAPDKPVADLLVFDATAGALRRVKVRGQLLHERDGVGYLMEGTNGLRFLLKQAGAFQAGDWLEVAGFPELSGPAPVLHEAVARKTGQGRLPQPLTLRPDELTKDQWDATLVRVEGVLLSQRLGREESTLEIQTGQRSFVARLRSKTNRPEALEVGSKLELAGVYSGLGGSRIEGREIDSFELLLNSPADVRVLATPPWWTPRRLLALAGVLLGGLILSAMWIKQLRHQVEERTAQLGVEIQQRERVEQNRLMERERTRVAQDLHDELGSGLTEVSMLGALAKNPSIPFEKRVAYLDQLTEASRALVTGLDEIVWAVNPQYDSTASLATYYSLFAQRFLNLAGIACRLQVAETVTDHPLESKLRHGIFLAFKEALNNVVRHSGATEVRLTIAIEAHGLVITIADNGRGLVLETVSPGQDGLAGLHTRMQRLGGVCRLQSQPGHGTVVELRLPLGPRET